MNDESVSIVATAYDAVYQAVPRSPALWKLWQDHAVGGDFPAEYGHISFVTLDELRALGEGLGLGAGTTLVDLACGMGGPSLWLTHQYGGRLAGIDASPVAVTAATRRAQTAGVADRAKFSVGRFDDSGLRDGEADAVVSFDALQYAPDKRAALGEMARILKPGGRLAITVFEVEPDRVASLLVLGDDPVADYRPLLTEAGFAIDSYEQTPGWQARLEGAYEAILDQAPALTAEMGPGYEPLALEVAVTLQRRPYRGRPTIVASR
jgi:SAM-dependent methyltransferase